MYGFLLLLGWVFLIIAWVFPCNVEWNIMFIIPLMIFSTGLGWGLNESFKK